MAVIRYLRCPKLRCRRVLLSCALIGYVMYFLTTNMLAVTSGKNEWSVFKKNPHNLTTFMKRTPVAVHVRATTPRSTTLSKLPWCPESPHITDYNVTLDLNQTTHEELIRTLGYKMQHGGHYVPVTCKSRERLAIIIPYRDRERNLLILLRNLLPFLWRQTIEFTVFLAEQTKEYPFNKGTLFNAAYRESERLGNFTCLIMQDTDLVPMDHRNLYRCGKNPRHLCLTSGQTQWKNKLMYSITFGGAIALRPKHLEAANGFSVSYYGWGLEDDDLALRLRRSRLRVDRYPIMIGKYYKLNHTKQTPNPQWNYMRQTLHKRHWAEGLNTLNYTLVLREPTPLYTRLLIRVPPPPTSIYGSYNKTTTITKNTIVNSNNKSNSTSANNNKYNTNNNKTISIHNTGQKRTNGNENNHVNDKPSKLKIEHPAMELEHKTLKELTKNIANDSP